MSNRYLSAELRRLVVSRAESLCEYCLMGEDDSFLGFEVDHVISEKHGGPTDESNLAFACFFYNRFKGSDIGSLVPGTGRFAPFFNPRTDRWREHFFFDERDLRIEPLGDVGIVTERILRFNDPERLLERAALYEVGAYPVPAARRRMGQSP